jgi:hypothetical protein
MRFFFFECKTASNSMSLISATFPCTVMECTIGRRKKRIFYWVVVGGKEKKYLQN